MHVGLKLHIAAVHEKNSIVINVAKILHKDLIWKYMYKKFVKN